MIKFFRKIRYNLMEKNKTGNYLRYAIGEIILVMIGILLALQVNNWNEQRKLLKNEQLLYNSIINDLSEDSIVFSQLINRAKERQKIHIRFYNESILGGDVSSEPYSSEFLEPTEILSSTWENHKNSIENISSSNIRQFLNKHFRDYQDVLNTTKTLNETIYNDVRKLMRDKEILDYNVIFKSSQDTEDFDKHELINKNKLSDIFGTIQFNSLTVELYLATQDVLQAINQLLESNKELQIQLMEVIEDEIEK